MAISPLDMAYQVVPASQSSRPDSQHERQKPLFEEILTTSGSGRKEPVDASKAAAAAEILRIEMMNRMAPSPHDR